MVTPFDSRLLVEEDGGRFWRLARPLTYTGARDMFIVPANFRTDLASVPRVFWALLPPFGAYQRAAVVHDWLCRNRQVSYRDADGVFRRILRESGVPRWQRGLLYAGVRLGHSTIVKEHV